MNTELETIARDKLKERIVLLPEAWQHRFKQMYFFKDLKEDILVVVDKMPSEKLDWAMTQVSNSLEMLKTKETK